MERVMKKAIWCLAAAGLVSVLAVLFPIGARLSAESLVGRPAPPIRSDAWLNTAPLDWDSLRGKVVLVKMWTFG